MVKPLVIDTQAKAAIRLLIKKDRSTSRRLRGPNKPSFLRSFNISFQSL